MLRPRALPLPKMILRRNLSPRLKRRQARFTQLSNYTKGTSAVLGKNLPGGYSDVTETADTNLVFSRDAGVPAPSVKVSITKVNTLEDKYVQITNQAVGAWDITGWKLVSAGNHNLHLPGVLAG